MTTQNNNNGNYDLWLLLLMVGVMIMSSFKHYDDESIGNLSRAAKLRRVITGGIGSAIVVFLTYEMLVGYLDVYPRMALGIAGLMGYIGAEAVITIMEEYVRKWADKKLGIKDKKEQKEREEY